MKSKREPSASRSRDAQASAIVVLRLTIREAIALDLVVINGWGDGDFAEWLEAGDPKDVDACKKAMKKLKEAIRKT